MKTLWIWLALVVIGIGAALFFGRSRVETGTAVRAWPMGLGVVADAPKHFPPTKETAAATKLVTLAKNAGVDLRAERDQYNEVIDRDVREAFADYLQKQLERGSDAIDAPPSDVTRWLSDKAASLDEIKELVTSGEEIAFATDINKRGPEAGPNLLGLQHLHRTFVVRALIATREKSPEAWDELAVAWGLTEPLWRLPDGLSAMTASTGSRFVNSAAGKLPMPPAPWFREVHAFHYERAFAAAQQAEAWRAKTPAFNVRVLGMTEEVLRARACDSSSPQFDAVRAKLGARATPSLISSWERLMRFRAEREATARVMLMRQGQPVPRESQCSDGSWEVTAKSFKFTRDIPVDRPQMKYALEYSR
ncbi:MAG TPA: hypothetical protein VNI54_10365 [Thermoanaerobaculia bacterium]|nr:hypothetical protein [Thermoanaerobaculia bacterium]